MFKKLLLLVLTLRIAASGQESAIEQLKKCVAFVYGTAHVKDPSGRTYLLEGTLGTAFFVYYPDPRGGEGYAFTYIVTAKHVLRDEPEGQYLAKIRVRVNNREGTGVSFATIPVTDEKGKLTWFDDKDDPNADVAVLSARPEVAQVNFRSIPISMFADADFVKKERVQEGDQVYLFGLMPQFTGENHNYPVVRHGYVALMSDEPISLRPNVKENVYALELGSWPGQSGSPVFLNLGGLRSEGRMFMGDSYSLMGMMLGSFQNERPFEIVTAPTNSVFLGDTSNVGISFVLPAAEILKVLNSKEAQQERDDFIAKRTLELNLHKMLHERHPNK